MSIDSPNLPSFDAPLSLGEGGKERVEGDLILDQKQAIAASRRILSIAGDYLKTYQRLKRETHMNQMQSAMRAVEKDFDRNWPEGKSTTGEWLNSCSIATGNRILTDQSVIPFCINQLLTSLPR